MKKANVKKIIAAALLIALTLAFPGTASAAAVSFTDVPGNHWASGDIAFAAEKGIVNGYAQYDGTSVFLPENSVTYEEAATMLYRALAAAGKITAAGDDPAEAEAKYLEIFDANSIAQWARAYVVYCLDNGIIGQDELGLFVNPGTLLGNPAPRITVAIWTAKALGKELAAAQYLPFTDASSITDAQAPYIDMLYRYGIMRGSLQLDGSIAFMGNSGVKRSEFCAIANRVCNNAGSGYGFDPERDTFRYSGAVGSTLRVSASATQVGLGYNYTAIAGIAGTDQIHYIGNPERRSGTVASVESVKPGISKVGITMAGGSTVYYIYDSSVCKSTAALTKGNSVTFIADGVYFIEMI